MFCFRCVLLIAMLLFALHPTPAQSDLIYITNPCPFAAPAVLDMECGTLTVPENRSDPDSDMIQLAVAVVRYTGADRQPDPIFYLDGGPGGSPLARFRQTYATRYYPLRATGRDLVLFDQRGTGFSQPTLRCPQYQAMYEDVLDGQVQSIELSAAARMAYRVDALIACGQTLAADYDLAGYTSAESAADVNDLRQALGYEQINLWGISYGTRLGLTILRDYPQNIRSAVLDSVYPPDSNLYLNIASSINQSLEKLFDACAADLSCHERYPDLRGIFYETVQRLNREPVRIDALYAPQGKHYPDTIFDGGFFINVIFQLLYDRDSLGYLPALLAEAHQGEFNRYIRIIGGVIAQQENISLGMNFAVQCHEEIAFAVPGDFTRMWRSVPDLRSYGDTSLVTESLFDICAVFADGIPPALENQAVNSNVPVLLLAGEFDPITPVDWARQAAESLTASTLIELSASSHGSSAIPGCAQDLLIAFFKEPQSALDRSCTQDLHIEFHIPRLPEDDFQTARAR